MAHVINIHCAFIQVHENISLILYIYIQLTLDVLTLPVVGVPQTTIASHGHHHTSPVHVRVSLDSKLVARFARARATNYPFRR